MPALLAGAPTFQPEAKTFQWFTTPHDRQAGLAAPAAPLEQPASLRHAQPPIIAGHDYWALEGHPSYELTISQELTLERLAAERLGQLITRANELTASDVRVHNDVVAHARRAHKNAGKENDYPSLRYRTHLPMAGGTPFPATKAEVPAPTAASLVEATVSASATVAPRTEDDYTTRRTEARHAAERLSARYEAREEANREKRLRRLGYSLGSLAIATGSTMIYYADAISNTVGRWFS